MSDGAAIVDAELEWIAYHYRATPLRLASVDGTPPTRRRLTFARILSAAERGLHSDDMVWEFTASDRREHFGFDADTLMDRLRALDRDARDRTVERFRAALAGTR